MKVHNHPPYRPVCNERIVNGQLVGACLPDPTAKPASDGEVCMIYRRNPRIVANACLGCRLSLNACQATRELESEPCCEVCRHD